VNLPAVLLSAVRSVNLVIHLTVFFQYTDRFFRYRNTYMTNSDVFSCPVHLMRYHLQVCRQLKGNVSPVLQRTAFIVGIVSGGVGMPLQGI
jgi:hypothetical protein